MPNPVYLDVDGKKVLSTNVTYSDVVVLYKQFIKKYGKVPTFNLCDSKHNMPQGRIINKIIEKEGITYNDFLLQFGKTGRVRTQPKNYDIYLEKYIKISKSLGHGLTINELYHNEYGLPQQNYFAKYCPDKSVNTFDEFVQWCGFESNKLKNDDALVAKKMIDLENKLGRPITKDDITLENVGFTPIVLNRIYGGINKAKEELGLQKTINNPPLPFELYKCRLDTVLSNISKNTHRTYISWQDIENPLYSNNFSMEHKTLIKAFKREGIDIFAYIKEKGFMMNPSNFSYHYTFDDGERVVSTMEYDFSQYLKSLGFKYNRDYFRDVMYKKFSNATGKINCDYEIHIGINVIYVEIAGIIYNTSDKNWNEIEFASKQENNYRDKMITKRNLMIESGMNYIFLFKDDMVSDRYKKILQDKINEFAKKAA